MADVATDPTLMRELLRQRGLLATDGNIRMMPFASSTGSGVSTNPSTSGGSAVAGAMGGIKPIVMRDNSGAELAVDPNAVDPVVMQNVPDEELNNILPTLVGAAAGSALALYIKSRLGKGGPATDIPVDPLAPLAAAPNAKTGTTGDGRSVAVAADDIIEGEFTEVDPSRSGPNRLPGAKALKSLPAPQDRKLNDTNASGQPKYLTETELKKRRAKGIAAGGTGVRSVGPAIPLKDAYSDLSEEEFRHARALADQLIGDRVKGRKRMYADRMKGVGRKGYPTTLPIDSDDAFNTVVRIIRENRKAVTRAVR